MSRYPRVVGTLDIERNAYGTTDPCRVVEDSKHHYVLERLSGHDAMGASLWERLNLNDDGFRLARCLLRAYGHERSAVLNQEVDDD